MDIILASASPRRKQLLGKIVDNFKIIPSNEEENVSCDDSLQLAKQLSFAKANSVFKSHQDSIVIGADTIVVLGKKVLGKPKDKTDAQNMLEGLSGKTHKVVTGVTVMTKDRTETFADTTLVTFRNLTEQQILKYIGTGSPMDKAGAYGIQDSGFVCNIEGSFDNVVGLPTEKLAKVLSQFLEGTNG